MFDRGPYRGRNPEPWQSAGYGLGDAVATIAQPIARALDLFFGTNLENCQGCAERKDKLNEFGKEHPCKDKET